MKKTAFRLISLLLLFGICTSLVPTSVFAVVGEWLGNENTPTLVDFIAGTATAEDIYGALDKSTVPAAIDYEEAVAKNHIARLYEDEGTDLYKVIFLNIDGSKTMYTFDFPVKYVDESGNIQDIRLEIADDPANTGGFETAANAAVTTFSARFADGIALEGNDTEIRLIPILPSANSGMATMSATNITASTATAQRVDEDTVVYPYDTNTTVEYSLTYTGFKEDIVVSEYTGQTEYPFRLLTNGLALEEIEGSFFLVDDEGNIEASIGDIIIFTADERNNAFGDIEPMTIVESQEYLLNIVVDADYLADPATTYPIRIDPTVEIKYSNNGDGAVEDITISTNTNFSGTYTSLYVGRRSTEGIARILMRFPALDVSNLTGATVTSATVRVRDLMCEDDPLDVSCHIFTGSEWDGDSATWANCSPNGYVTTPLSTNTMSWSIGDTFSSKHWYLFDVTQAVQGWIDGSCNPNKGLIFKVADSVENGDDIRNRTFGSYNRSSYRPSLTVNYTEGDSGFLESDTYYLNNRGTGKYLNLNASRAVNGVSGLLSSLGNQIQWQIQQVQGYYVIRSVAEPTKYLSGSAYPSNDAVSVTTVNNSTIPDTCLWVITAASPDGCLIRNVASAKLLYSTGTGLSSSNSTGAYGGERYETFVWRMASISYYGNTSASPMRELSASTAISNIEGSKDASVNINVNPYYDELWASPSDFTYSFDKAGVATYLNGQMNLLQYGGTKVQATHKVTGRGKTFYILVGFSTTVTATPLADHIVAGLNQPYDVWPASEESDYYAWPALVRAEALKDIHERALMTIVGGALLQNPDAASMLTHFLNNKGTRYDVEMKQMLSEWDTARNFRERDMNYVMQAVEASATYSNKTIRTISSIGCTVSEGTNWGRAVGSYTTSIVCTYKKTSSTSYVMQVTYELHDVYDWDRTITSMGNLPVSPREMWELHHAGLAKNYEVFGQNTFTLTWTQGQTFGEGAVISNEE